ncbi:hypothetical protein D3P96_05915 [Weissella viridescens]|uniref:DUF4352 domain-containing protein n=1 Tax=Weissella viridescens TaxID=1629 RepID=A0A3P2RFT6_WEIVI|nr:hypothetical protein [Weissella viridescens]RRG17690.1 hypothetical protein D3P96_05915 [Weissella viridescens]
MKKSAMYFAFSMLLLILMGVGYLWMQGGLAINGQVGAGKRSEKAAESSVVYDVPKSDLKSKNFVKNAMPTRQGDYTVTRQGVRVRLAEDKAIQGEVTSGPVSYKMKRIQLLQNEARTEQAQNVVRKALNVPNLPKNYTAAEIHYDITNHTDQTILTDGVATVSYGYKDVMTTLGGLVNGSELSNEGIAPGATQEGYAIVWVPKQSVKSFKTFNIEFASTYNADGREVSEKTPQLKVNI